MNRIFFLLLLHCSQSIYAQLPPESDPHRGIYIDKFAKSSQTISNSIDPAFSILSVDTNFDGIFEKEDLYLDYARMNHITYISLYDMGTIIGDGRMIWNENSAQYEDLEKHLCRFMEKARKKYGITQIGAVGGSASFFSNSLPGFLNRFPVSPACTTCQADFDVLVSEYEYWGACNSDLPNYIAIMDAMDNLKNTYNASHPNNKMTTDAYLAFLGYCGNPGMAQTAQVSDGCKNCSPFAGCSNPHPRKMDRVLYSIMTGNPTGYLFNEINVFEDLQTFDSTDFHPMLYAGSYKTGSTYNFCGDWLEADPRNTIHAAEYYFYYYWRTFSNSAFGQPQMNDIQPGGVQWFAGSHMVGRPSHPMMIKVIETYCTNDSARITLNYLGPDEWGTLYKFWITRDSDGAVVYPVNGLQFSGVSQPTVNDPGNRTINFKDTILFPPLYLPPGNYTTHIDLHYNLGNGEKYSSDCKFIVDTKPRIEIVGDREFCYGHTSMLVTNKGGTNYDWFRNGKFYSSSVDQFLKVTDDGMYHCTITGGACPSNTDTIRVKVHPMPDLEINAVCNGNGTVTLKTNLFAANPTSTQLYGPGGVTYRWNTGATTDQITVNNPTSRTTYRVLITDPYSKCQVTKIMDLPNPLSTQYTATIQVTQQPTSQCAQDGILTANLSPVPPQWEPVRYYWSNGATTQSINVGAGSYAVTMKTYNVGCSFYDSVTIGTQPNRPSLHPSVSFSHCASSPTGDIELFPSGGNPPFKYEWKDIPNDSIYNPFSRDLEHAYPGTYALTVTDSNGCSYDYNITVQSGNTPIRVTQGSVVPVTGCSDNQNGSAAVNITGGSSPYSQTWIDKSGQAFPAGSNLHAGSYRVIATDALGCTGFSFVHVPSVNAPIYSEVLDSSVTEVSCDSMSDGKLYLCIHGGIMPYTVDTPWNIQQNIISLENLSAGFYAYTITDSMGCVFLDTMVVDSAYLHLSASPIHTSCVGCPNGKIQLTYGGGLSPYSISWSPSVGQLNNNAIENLPAGTYDVCITDSNLCIECSQATILDDPLAVLSVESSQDFRIFPNPATESITVVFADNLKNVSKNVCIQNVYGQIVYWDDHTLDLDNLDVSGISPGIYMLKVEISNVFVGCRKFLIQR